MLQTYHHLLKKETLSSMLGSARGQRSERKGAELRDGSLPMRRLGDDEVREDTEELGVRLRSEPGAALDGFECGRKRSLERRREGRAVSIHVMTPEMGGGGGGKYRDGGGGEGGEGEEKKKKKKGGGLWGGGKGKGGGGGGGEVGGGGGGGGGCSFLQMGF